MIDAKFGGKNHSFIPATAIGRGHEPPDTKNDPQTKLDGPVDQILVVKKKPLIHMDVLKLTY
jgi:hypothetical protein